jgi:ABC-type amino acid transport system permease subunit
LGREQEERAVIQSNFGSDFGGLFWGEPFWGEGFWAVLLSFAFSVTFLLVVFAELDAEPA